MTQISQYSSLPRTVFRGVKDNSAPVIEMPVASLPIHLPLFVGLAPWGEENRARFVNAAGQELLYGAESLDPNGPYFTHQTEFARLNYQAGASAMFLRLVDPAATKANLRFGIDLVEDELPEYQRNSDGSFRYDVNGAKIPTGETYVGYRLQIRKTPVGLINGGSTYGIAGASEGNMTSVESGETSTFYPFLDIEARFRGARGNNLGIRLSAPTVASSEPADESVQNRLGAFVYRIQQVQRTNATSTPTIIPTIDGANFLNISFKQGAKDTTTNSFYDARKVVINGFEGKTPDTFQRWGNMERIHVYGNHLDTVLALLAAKESALSGRTVEPHEINFLTGVDINGIPYRSFVIEGPEAGGLLMTESTSHFFVGGSDGSVSVETFNNLVGELFQNLDTYPVPLYNMAQYPFSSFWDSGFPTEVKLKFVSLHSLRPDVWIATATQDVTQQLNSASVDSSIGVALRSRFRSQQESSEFGTKALRFFAQPNAGYLIGSDYDGLVPFLGDTLYKVASYMGAGNGKMVPGAAFGRGQQNVVSRFRDHNCQARPDTARNNDWSNGLTLTDPYDIDRLFVPAYQSMYETQNSVLSSLINMAICCNLTRLGRIVWSNWTGDSQLTDEEFFAEVEQNLLDLVESAYDGRAKVVPRAYKTKLDDDLGFSYRLDIDVGFENMKTVQSLAVIAQRRRDME